LTYESPVICVILPLQGRSTEINTTFNMKERNLDR
jgi:hypothetical protein